MLLPRKHRLDLCPELATEAQREGSDERVPSTSDFERRLVVRAQRSRGRRVADRYPRWAHVFEVERARPRVLEVTDQLAENPRLIGVGDPTMLLLHGGLSQHFRPRQV